MKTIRQVFAIVALFSSASAFADSVRIGTKDVELTFASGFPGLVETNRIAVEMNRFFASGDDLSDFFDANSLSNRVPAQLNPGRGGGGPDVEEAADIRYYPGEDERILIGTNAIVWIAGVISQAVPYTNTLQQAEALLANLASGSLTNDMLAARAAFVVNGTILGSDDRDEELLRGVESYWTHLQYYPLTLLDWKMGRFTPDGQLLPSLRFKFADVDMWPRQIESELLVFLDGQWRIALFE